MQKAKTKHSQEVHENLMERANKRILFQSTTLLEFDGSRGRRERETESFFPILVPFAPPGCSRVNSGASKEGKQRIPTDSSLVRVLDSINCNGILCLREREMKKKKKKKMAQAKFYEA